MSLTQQHTLDKIATKRVAIVHDWLVTFGGAECVLAEIIQAFPHADLFAVVDFFTDNDRSKIGGRKATTTFIQRLPGAQKHYRSYLALMPIAIEQLDLSKYDLIISSSHAVAKGILSGPDQVHVSYVHSPIRYAWDMQHQYLREAGLESGIKSWIARWILHKIRIWDFRTSHGVDQFIANSHFIARRIRKTYGRTAEVIYPPVSIEKFELNEKKEKFYLTASRMVPYKRIDLIVRAFEKMPNRRLLVVGSGPDFEKVKKLASPNVEILGYQPDEVLHNLMGKAQAFVFAAEEDFGITPVEAQACGTPVIAFGKGGALESIVGFGDTPTGLFFEEQTVESICASVEVFEQTQHKFIPMACRTNAERFAPSRFREVLRAKVEDVLAYRREMSSCDMHI